MDIKVQQQIAERRINSRWMQWLRSYFFHFIYIPTYICTYICIVCIRVYLYTLNVLVAQVCGFNKPQLKSKNLFEFIFAWNECN